MSDEITVGHSQMKNYLLNKSPKPHARLMHSLQAAKTPGINEPGPRIDKRLLGLRKGKPARALELVVDAPIRYTPRNTLVNETPEETVRRLSRQMRTA